MKHRPHEHEEPLPPHEQREGHLPQPRHEEPVPPHLRRHWHEPTHKEIMEKLERIERLLEERG